MMIPGCCCYWMCSNFLWKFCFIDTNRQSVTTKAYCSVPCTRSVLYMLKLAKILPSVIIALKTHELICDMIFLAMGFAFSFPHLLYLCRCLMLKQFHFSLFFVYCFVHTQEIRQDSLVSVGKSRQYVGCAKSSKTNIKSNGPISPHCVNLCALR